MFSKLWSGSASVAGPTTREAESESPPPPTPSITSDLPTTTKTTSKARRKSTKAAPAAPNPAAELHTLVKACPPKVLHGFILDRLDKDSSSPFETLDADLPTLTAFFTGLTPPPVKHCARCHLDYVDVENGTRSCVMEHDDESAHVFKVKGLHETTWNCCGQTVDGDGDLGPPAGWCFEGLHTSDRGGARYRADASPDDDKLESCAAKHCGQTPKTRLKRTRTNAEIDSDEEDALDLANLKPRDKHARRVSGGVRARSKSVSRLQPALTDAEMRDVDGSEDDSKSVKASTTAKKPRKSLPKKKVDTEDGQPKPKASEREGSAESASTTVDGNARGKKPRGAAAGKPRGRPSKGAAASNGTPSEETKTKEKPVSKKRRVGNN